MSTIIFKGGFLKNVSLEGCPPSSLPRVASLSRDGYLRGHVTHEGELWRHLEEMVFGGRTADPC